MRPPIVHTDLLQDGFIRRHSVTVSRDVLPSGLGVSSIRFSLKVGWTSVFRVMGLRSHGQADPARVKFSR